jgi:hypothetical protein
MTLIMTSSIMTLNTITLSITTLSIAALKIMTQHYDTLQRYNADNDDTALNHSSG